ncbi:deleted in malignant brain tumors 1 protein-like isoform X2 [Pomacea canaliculata]|uniref:deleted in malignant brain tumors 1 protein-like isoform X2 n=1 Tax=Pomacea canaliculata TaxID=400727 RepID=UPI000D73BD7A|nr:deleted in malignant brain tumors 1 protein-like isoform X2 [Pomacea canaliculata]
MNSCGHCACFMCAVLITGIIGQSQRLVDGTSRYNGRVEIFYNKTWNTVCNDRMDKKEAQVICKMLGFNSSRALVVRTEMYKEGSGPILLDEVQCQGSETSLTQCQHDGFYKHDCYHYEDLAIICSRQPERLHLATLDRGRVQILLEGEWYTVCIPDVHIARVLCRQLGQPSAAAVPLKTISSGPYVGTKLMSGLKCNGQENSIIDCDQTTFNNEEWRSKICTSDSDYSGVLCVDSPPLFILVNEGRYPVMERTNVTLTCMSELWPNVANYTWPETAGAVAIENDLIIENVKRTHNGEQVQCLAVSSDGVILSSDTFTLQVYYYPIITIQMSSTRSAIVFAHIYQVRKGQNTTFSCDAVSNPLPASITWSGRVNSTTGQLRIIAAEAGRHNGVYTCTVVTKTVDDDERLPLKASRRLIIDVKDNWTKANTDLSHFTKTCRDTFPW